MTRPQLAKDARRVALPLLCALLLGCAGRGGESPPADDPQSTPPAATEQPKPDGSNPIRVMLSDAEREQLRGQVESDLKIARAAAVLRPAADLLDEAQRQRWDTLVHYIEQAQQAQEGKDLRAASDLALKARLLADEIRPR